MKKTILIRFCLFLLLPLLLATTPLFAMGIETTAGMTQVAMKGNISFKGASLNLKDDLNYDKENAFVGKIKAELPLFLPNIYLMATPMRFDNKGFRTDPFQYGFSSFASSTPFDSNLQLDLYDVALFYGIPFLETASRDKLDVEFGFNLRVIDFKGEISQASTLTAERKKATLPVPMGYVGLAIRPVEAVALEGEIRGIAYEGNRYIDFSSALKIYLKKVFVLSGGYRYQTMRVDYNDLNIDLSLGGPLFEVGLKF